MAIKNLLNTLLPPKQIIGGPHIAKVIDHCEKIKKKLNDKYKPKIDK